jgi:hypothetical protein
MGALGKRDRHHATARDMHEPADTEPGRKTAGTVVILAGDTIGAIAQTSRETTGPTRLTLTGIEFCQPGQFCVAGDQLLRNSGLSSARRTGRSRTSSLTARALSRPGSIGDHVVNRSFDSTRRARPAPGTNRTGAAVDRLRAEGFDVHEADITRLSPFVRHHVNTLGRSCFHLPDLPGGLRPPGDVQQTERPNVLPGAVVTGTPSWVGGARPARAVVSGGVGAGPASLAAGGPCARFWRSSSARRW